MLGLIPKLPLYWAFRTFGWPAVKPFSVVISVSFRCNSKCRTCDIWRKPNDDLSVDEWEKVFASLGHAPFYMTFTGGEPFLRPDLDELVIRGYQQCKPEVITIPTNGMLTERVLAMTERMCRECPTSSIGINLSLDGIGDEHDDIRGVEGNWKLSMATWQRLKELQKTHKNLVLTVHTVISRFNAHRFQEIQEGLKFLEPDSYITEVAEERVELDTVGWGITPQPADYDEIADFLSQQARQAPAKGIARFTQAFRAQYYQLAKRVLHEHDQVIPCYAGWASAHIAPNGDLWSCCIRAESVGNVRDHDYDITPLWRSRAMAELRGSIKRKECACPMANANYANMLLHPPTVIKVMSDVVRHQV